MATAMDEKEKVKVPMDKRFIDLLKHNQFKVPMDYLFLYVHCFIVHHFEQATVIKKLFLKNIFFCLFLRLYKNPGRKIRHIYGTYTAVNGHIRAVYAPYFYRNPGRWFTTVFNENTVCIRPYTVQNAVLYTVPIYGDQDYGEMRPVFVPYLIVNGRIRRSYA